MKIFLITGASGFVGNYLAKELLKDSEYQIFGTYLIEESKNASDVKDLITFIKLDLTNREEVLRVIEKIKPDGIFHLAAMASVADSFKNPWETIKNNVKSEINLFEGLRNANLLTTKIIIISSSEVYGFVESKFIPINENTPFNPINPYAVSKVTCDLLGYQYNISYKMPIIRARPFNHIGPGQRDGYVVSSFAKQIANIEKGAVEPIIRVGNLDSKRDFTDVRDMVRAYKLLFEKGEIGEVYNLGRGKSYKISDILNMLLSLSNVKINIEIDPDKFRPSDMMDNVCDNSKFVMLTQWKPEIMIEQTLKETLDYWRNIV